MAYLLRQVSQLPLESYVEVVWESVFDEAGTRRAREGVALTPGQHAEALRLKNELSELLRMRAQAIDTQLGVESDEAISDDTTRAKGTTRGGQARGILDWFRNPDEYLGDFAKYLVSGDIRRAVRGRLKDKLQPLIGFESSISLVSHSWGTVVSYDTLLDLEREQENLKIGAFVTLGSPLWLVRRFLEDISGRKPSNVGNWININARGDKVGGWLEPEFAVDRDFGVPSIKGVGPHSSYFVEANIAVQRDLVAPFIRGEFQ